MSNPAVERHFDHPNVGLQCACGWAGLDADIEDWAVERDRDRVVRRCPACDEPVPEWGTLPSIEGAMTIARGPLAETLAAADYIDR